MNSQVSGFATAEALLPAAVGADPRVVPLRREFPAATRNRVGASPRPRRPRLAESRSCGSARVGERMRQDGAGAAHARLASPTARKAASPEPRWLALTAPRSLERLRAVRRPDGCLVLNALSVPLGPLRAVGRAVGALHPEHAREFEQERVTEVGVDELLIRAREPTDVRERNGGKVGGDEVHELVRVNALLPSKLLERCDDPGRDLVARLRLEVLSLPLT